MLLPMQGGFEASCYKHSGSVHNLSNMLNVINIVVRPIKAYDGTGVIYVIKSPTETYINK